MSNTFRRLAVTTATTAAVSALALVPSPAMASSMFFSKSSGTTAAVSWLEMGELPAAANALGNAHFGDLYVEDLGRGRARAFGTVFDLQCKKGVVPTRPGHGEEPTTRGCTLVGTRYVEGGTGLTFTIDRELTKATLTGTLSVGDAHGGEGPVGTPPVSITWTGAGALEPYSESGRYTDAYGTYSYRYSGTRRSATIAPGSRIGPMVFDDEQGESSTADLGSYSSSSRQRS